MSVIFRTPSAVSCFYCQSSITPAPRNPRAFRCPHCECWNRYDEHGELLSDEPAMHDENLNSRSFAKRGMRFTISSFWFILTTAVQLPRARTVFRLRTATRTSAIHAKPTKCFSQICCQTISHRLMYVLVHMSRPKLMHAFPILGPPLRGTCSHFYGIPTLDRNTIPSRLRELSTHCRGEDQQSRPDGSCPRLGRRFAEHQGYGCP